MSVRPGGVAAPFLTLLDPGRWSWLLLASAAVAAILWGFLVGRGATSLASATLLAVGVLSVPALLKWRDDVRRLGLAATVLGVLLALQGFHTVEHLAQVVQYYALGWPAGRSLGLITSANAEWIHFGWNWLVSAGIVFLVARGLRSPWAWALLGWAGLHSLEHTYLFIRYLRVASELGTLGLSAPSVAQSLPGVLGRDGLLALQSWCGRIPGLTTAPRVAVHFWWNAGEIVLLGLAAQRGLAGIIRSESTGVRSTKIGVRSTRIGAKKQEES